MFLSIIIPVYNVREYISRCVASILKECSGIEYEAILVDDGSTDGSGELCDELAKKDNRFLVLHKSNGGLSDARNYGVGYAQGEYVFYLDSDDYLAEGGMTAMAEVARQTKSDVVCGNFYYQYANYKTLFEAEAHNPLVYKGGEEALAALIEGKRYQNFAWGKLIRRELAQKFLFPKGKLFEDTYWCHLILHQANQIAVIDKPVIHYTQREGSISYAYKLKSLDILDGYTERLMFFEQHYPMLVDMQKSLMASNCINQAWMICRYLNKKDKTAAIKKLRDSISDCKLIDNPLLESRQQHKLRMIMQNMQLFKWSVMIERTIEKIIGR